MKQLSTIFVILSFCLSVTFINTSCSDTKATHPSVKAAVAVDLPKLLDRSPNLGSQKERTLVVKTYKDLSTAIQTNPGDIDSRLKLVQLFMLEARVTGEHGHYYPAALTVLDQIFGRGPAKDDRFYALSLKASVLLSLHKFQQALDVAKEAVVINPHNAQIHGALVDANVELGNYEKAVEVSDKMVSIRPDLRSYSRISYLREIHGDVEGAIEAMQMAVSAGYPGYEETAWCRLTLGDLYLNYNMLKEAKMQYETILTERIDYPFAYEGLAKVAWKEGKTDKAEELLKKACELIPEVGFYQTLAELYTETGRKEEADKLVGEILIMLADDEAHGHQMSMEYADLYLNLIGDVDMAMQYATKAYEARPANIDVNLLMAQVYQKKGDIDMARKHLKVAQKTNSQDPEMKGLANWVIASN